MMAANISLLMSLIANVLGSGIIFFSGPSADLAYLQSNVNISIYDVEQLSPVEEKALGDNNIFFDFNQNIKGELNPKLTQLASEHRLAIIFKTHQGICNLEVFHTVVNNPELTVTNRNGNRNCFGIRSKHNINNPLILKSPNCYDNCTDMCPKGEYLDGCYCLPKYYDWKRHLKTALYHPGGLIFIWISLTFMVMSFCSIYFFSFADKIKYLHALPQSVASFLIATNFIYYATRHGSTTGHCLYYLVWLHIFMPNVPVNKLLTCHYDVIQKHAKFIVIFGSYAISGLFILLQMILLDPTDSSCFGTSFPFDTLLLTTRLFVLHMGLICIFTLAGHCFYSKRSSLWANLFDAGMELLFLICLNLVFKSSSLAAYSRDSIEIMTKTFELTMETNLSMYKDHHEAKERLNMATVLQGPELVMETSQAPDCNLRSNNPANRRTISASLARSQSTVPNKSRANTI